MSTGGLEQADGSPCTVIRYNWTLLLIFKFYCIATQDQRDHLRHPTLHAEHDRGEIERRWPPVVRAGQDAQGGPGATPLLAGVARPRAVDRGGQRGPHSPNTRCSQGKINLSASYIVK